ncbi:MAG: divalent-cation tolerance protein CutA [Gemmatimonadetes bacterium]|nr:divalent-cation tolerance protein CutA [Gemmatimonadota bacterium]
MGDTGAAADATVVDDGAEVVTVLMTAPGTGAATDVVGRLVEERLVACGNILPGAVSIYRWEGEVHRDDESVVILKTTRRLLARVLARAEQLHPYDVPELLVHEVADGAGAYLDWVRRECRPGAGG